jgi:hypothetical protein
MPTLRRPVALMAVVAALCTVLAGPAHADPPATGAVCNPGASRPAARTVDFWLENRTAWIFLIARSHLDHGVWSTTPPVRIEPWSWVCWRSESNGFMTGTQGWANYVAADTGGSVVLTLAWNNPFHGGNSFACRPPQNHECVGRPGSGGGTHPTPIFQLASRV